MRTMYDALPGAFHGIPADADLVAGYIDGGPGYPVMTDDLWALYPNAVHVRIATQAGTNDGHVLDVEAGDATPYQAPVWVAMRRAAGADPSVYCSESAWQTVRDAFAAAGMPEPHWWIASYHQPPDTTIPTGAVAHQWGGNMDGGYDVSSVADYWPGVDGGDVTPEQMNQLGQWMQEQAANVITKLVGDGTGTQTNVLGAWENDTRAVVLAGLKNDHGDLVAAIVAALPKGSGLTQSDVETAVRNVLHAA